MKKKMMMIFCVLTMLCLLTGCTQGTMSQLESLFSNSEKKETVIQTGSSDEQGDTVTIPRAEYEQYRRFSDVLDIYNAASQYFYIEPDYDKMVEYAARGLMAGLDDPYSFYYSPEEFQKMLEDDTGNYVGIGVMISANYNTQQCTIIRVFDGSPAEESGVHRGDILYRVGDDLYVTPDTLDEAVSVMRGQEGTTVEVTFIRNGEEITKTIERRGVSVNQVNSKMLDGQIGYIAYYEFAGQSDKEFENALNELEKQQLQALIIDLRDNRGGWVEHARYIADLFLDAGELCYLVYRDGEEVHTEYQTKDGKVEIPIVILMNEYSASASEILAGALRDRANAKIVGVTSFGKGIIQVVLNVGDKGAGYQMTVAQYFTPNGYAVHKNGIVPDLEVPLEEGDNGMYEFADIQNDPQLKKAYETALELIK